MYVIGTAGHVDHGKSTLVRALTGIDPDRLAEEKAREMTIDLGFAWLKLGDEEVGVVDVPGHRDFIENMLAGVGGIDLALFVVAADEGVMPQTREHLAILDLLEVQSGVVALTKTDMIDDPEWLDLIKLDLSAVLAGTVLADAPIVSVSARTGQGLETLKDTLWQRLQTTMPRPDIGQARLPVDRVFTLAGFGTVVTGTLLNGRFQIGDAVEIQPSGRKGRVRGLQTHKTKLEVARPGSRVAINLTGIDRDEVKRGDVVAKPGTISGTTLLDAYYRHLPDADAPLKHNMDVKLFLGAAEVQARTRVLGAAHIEPGQTGWIQLALAEPVAAGRGDHLILRRPSPGNTLGGGRVVDPHPGRQHRRFRPEVLARLEAMAQGTPTEQLLQALLRLEPTTQAALIKQAGLDAETAVSALHTLETEGQLIRLDPFLLSQTGWGRLVDKTAVLLNEYHKEFRLRLGIPREELRSRLKLTSAVFAPFLAKAAADGVVVEHKTAVSAPSHHITFTPHQQKAVDSLLQRMAGAGVNSPSVKECKTAVGDDAYFALVEGGQLRPLNDEVVYAAADYERLTGTIKAYVQKNGRINAAQTRDLFNTSRKYAIALLEHLDELKITRRVGDERMLY